jgi:hypothetical protein
VTVVIQGDKHIGKGILTHVLVALPAQGEHVRSAVGTPRCVCLTVTKVQRVHVPGCTPHVCILTTTHTHSVRLTVRVPRKASQVQDRSEKLPTVRATRSAVVVPALVSVAVVGNRGGGGDHVAVSLVSVVVPTDYPTTHGKTPESEVFR